ncbi:carboxypeptidase S [Roridomyces roridus]|uniref:Carboxypeptidase S n=1 Tax=Roridomyces roridus TaxID=1738132 RepID=A0AAD7C1M9_9AGAR|nr:carboxypeptidase S [Roridomyces roridus]
MDDTKIKAELPGVIPAPRQTRRRWPILLACLALVGCLHLLRLVSPTSRLPCDKTTHQPAVCPQSDTLVPEKNSALWTELTQLQATDDFLGRAVAQLSAAVQIPTETFDSMGPVGEDPRWVTRGPFVDHLVAAFPLVHAAMDLQKVNTYGLVYTWQGSDASLKPLLLMGHYDVVPVAPLSVDEWTHPAYSGHFDGEFIWGRGCADDKSGVIGILTTIELLLENDFKPTRTIVLSFGFDEEAGGFHGAGHLGPALLERFGPDSFAMIVDEGAGFVETYGAIFATPGVAEKGYTDISVEVQSPGGHSSIPPEHTSIGILAALIVQLEANPPPAHLVPGTTLFEMAQCLAAHAPDLPVDLKRVLLRAGHSEKARKEAERMLFSSDPAFRALAGTTQAVDVISGGVKSNALPEQAVAIVNHRIATQSSVNETLKRNTDLLRDLAIERFNLSVIAHGEQLTPASAASAGTLILSTPRTLEPAPITPSDAPPFKLLAGTIRAAIRASSDKIAGDSPVYVAPGMMSGNTDTRYTWALSRHIFRYGHGSGGMGGIHTVNEHIRATDFVGMITFFTTLILNVDEAVL